MKIIKRGTWIECPDGSNAYIGWKIDCEGGPLDLDKFQRLVQSYTEKAKENG